MTRLRTESGKLIIVTGLAIIVMGYYWLSTLDQDTSTWGFILRVLPIGIGYGIFQSPNNSAVMGSVPRERLGVASGLLSISRAVGQTTGIAVLGALWAARVAFYNGAPPPGGATTAPPAAQVAGLQDTVAVDEFAEGISVGGAHQMIGNVWEWTSRDFHGDNHPDGELRLDSPMKSIRGGALDTYFDNQATCQFRSGESPLSRRHNISFRCAVGVGDLVLSGSQLAALQPQGVPESTEPEAGEAPAPKAEEGPS